MSERRTIRVPAPAGTKFAPEAFQHSIGDVFPLKVEGEPFGTATCVEAEVVDEGDAMLVTLEADSFPDMGDPFFAYDLAAMEADPLNEGQTFPRP